MSTMTFKDAARTVLLAAGEPLSYKEITRRALEKGLVSTEGRTPEANMNALMSVDLSRHGSASTFIRTAPGVFGLREWIGQIPVTPLPSDNEEAGQIRVPHYPIYADTTLLLPLLDGTARTDFLALKSEVYGQRGTPQEQVDWSDPDRWIGERLTGRSAEIARQIWVGTHESLNPRYLTGHWALISRYELLETDGEGILHLTEKGRSFIDDPNGPTVQEVDAQEGLDRLLTMVAELGPASRADLLPPFSEFARSVSKLRADSSIKSFLWARLRNLCERGLIERTGRSYSATASGLAWIATFNEGQATEGKQATDILQLARERRKRVRSEIAERLSSMDPFAFEGLVKTLLESMDYEDVEVTSKSGDGGVDVIGRIQLGITEVVEVVQVKRHARNIQRSVMDALRGSLHRFHAVRGTIITTGGFARGTKEAAFEPGAPPITLIDGERLIDLMIDHDIGVKKRRLELLEVDPSAFETPTEDEVPDE